MFLGVHNPEDDSKKPIIFLARQKVIASVYYVNFVLGREESWTNKEATMFDTIVQQTYLLP
jgi:hypothetical protein